jgi:hypothetical protein
MKFPSFINKKANVFLQRWKIEWKNKQRLTDSSRTTEIAES